jgi:hypothetical protein
MYVQIVSYICYLNRSLMVQVRKRRSKSYNPRGLRIIV